MFSSTYKEPHPRGILNENPMQNPGFSVRSQFSWDSLVNFKDSFALKLCYSVRQHSKDSHKYLPM